MDPEAQATEVQAITEIQTEDIQEIMADIQETIMDILEAIMAATCTAEAVHQLESRQLVQILASDLVANQLDLQLIYVFVDV
jgi:hypothetical protein